MPIKNELDNGKIITYKIKFIDKSRKYLSEILYSDMWTDCKFHLGYMSAKDSVETVPETVKKSARNFRNSASLFLKDRSVIGIVNRY